MFEAKLKSRSQPKLGALAVTFPIPEERYETMILALQNLQIGDVRKQDCCIESIRAPDCPALLRMTNTMANVDELDWLGKQLESFDRYELLQFTSKYALSDRLVCGECGTLYRRCTWTSRGRKYPVWRCTSRLNYGTKYCHDSPTIKEEPLQAAILAAINSVMSNKPALLDLIKNAVSLELLPVQGQTMSLADIERRLEQLDERFQQLLAEAIDADDKEACNAQFAEILAEQTALKKQKEAILQGSADADRVCTRMKQAEEAIESAASTITEWKENAVRQIVERVTVLSADEVLVQIKGGAEIKQRLER